MRYKIIGENTIEVISHIEVNGNTISALTDDLDKYIDELGLGKKLDETAEMPVYNFKTQELKIVYSENDATIFKGYEVVEIMPSESEVLRAQIATNITDIECISDMLIEIITM